MYKRQVYNRLTDFDLSEPAHLALRNAFDAKAVVLTPHPRVHALMADKRNLIALSQDNFKRLLAYSGISHAGYMLLAILSLKSDSSSALFFYGAAYVLATIGAFAVAIPVFKATGKETIDAFDGLGRKKPFLAAMLTMSMLSLAGIPPLAGFLGKYYIFSEAIKNGYTCLLYTSPSPRD